MLEQRLSHFYQRLRNQVHQQTRQPFWHWKISAGLILLCWLWAFPAYQLWLEPEPSWQQNWDALRQQFAHPFQHPEVNENLHGYQARYRMLVPLLVGWTGIDPRHLVLLLPILGLFFGSRLLLLMESITGSRVQAVLIAFGLMSSYLFRAFTTDLAGYFDAFAFAFLLLAMQTRLGLSQFLFLLAALLTDERSLLSLPFVVGFHWTWHNNDNILRNLGRMQPPFPAALVAVGAAITLRIFLSSFLDFGPLWPQSEWVGLSVLRENFQTMPLLLLSGLGFWTLWLALPSAYMLLNGQKIQAILVGIYTSLALMSSLLVLDVTRSVSYLFPGFLWGMAWVCQRENATFRKQLLLGFSLAGLFFPALFAIGNTLVWQGPFFPKILKILF